MTQTDLTREHVVPDSRDTRGGAREAARDELAIEADRLEDLGAAIALQRRDPHLREGLEQPLVAGLHEVLDGRRGIEALFDVGPLLDQLLDGLEREVGVDGGRAVADQQRELRNLAGIARLADDPAARAQLLAHQVMVHGAGREQHRDRREIGAHTAIREDQDVDALANRGLRLGAQRVEPGSQPLAAVGDLEETRQRARAEPGEIDAADALELVVRDHGMLDAEHARMRRGLLEQVALGADRRVQRHHRNAR